MPEHIQLAPGSATTSPCALPEHDQLHHYTQRRQAPPQSVAKLAPCIRRDSHPKHPLLILPKGRATEEANQYSSRSPPFEVLTRRFRHLDAPTVARRLGRSLPIPTGRHRRPVSNTVALATSGPVHAGDLVTRRLCRRVRPHPSLCLRRDRASGSQDAPTGGLRVC